MNIGTFFEHWGVSENPFGAEEARHDAVFGRLGFGPTTHPDFAKILGSLDRPSTSVVFGEKGSGKTAIRLQIERRIAQHNDANPDDKVLLVAYDDLNPNLDRFIASLGRLPAPRKRRPPEGRSESGSAAAAARNKAEEDTLRRLRRLRLVDHMDGILGEAAATVVDGLLGDPRGPAEITRHSARAMRRGPGSARRDLMVLQACYDRPDSAPERTRRLRRRIRAPRGGHALLWSVLALGGALLPVGVIALWWWQKEHHPDWPWLQAFIIALAIWAALLFKRLVWDTWRLGLVAARLSRQLRVMHRPANSYLRSLCVLPREDARPATLPCDDLDDHRYAMFDRLLRAIRPLGFTGVIVVLDRLDEPTLVSGDPDRMQAIVWPMLNNKLLQMDRVGFKLLLPIELRHHLFRESTAFFQQARFDKQNLIERLSWTGATLYDLANARLAACRVGTGDTISLVDLFAEDVSRQDLVDALDQMHQPRDAFKFLYQCILEHCSNVTEEAPEWRIPRLVLESVRRLQSDRVQQLYRGVRPA